MQKFALTINVKLKKKGSFWSRLHSTSKANKEDVNQGTCLLVQCKLQNLHCQFLPGYMPARLYQNEIFALSSYHGTWLSFFSQNKIIFCQNTSVRTPSLDSDVSSTFGRVSVARSFYIRWTIGVICRVKFIGCVSTPGGKYMLDI